MRSTAGSPAPSSPWRATSKLLPPPELRARSGGIRRHVGFRGPQLEPRADELAALATRRLRERGEREARDLDETLRRQRERIVEELGRHEGRYQQIALEFDEEERRQLQANMRYWRMRLHQFDRDLDREPARIRAFYEVQAQRDEPVGLVYLWRPAEDSRFRGQSRSTVGRRPARKAGR